MRCRVLRAWSTTIQWQCWCWCLAFTAWMREQAQLMGQCRKTYEGYPSSRMMRSPFGFATAMQTLADWADLRTALVDVFGQPSVWKHCTEQRFWRRARQPESTAKRTSGVTQETSLIFVTVWIQWWPKMAKTGTFWRALRSTPFKCCSLAIPPLLMLLSLAVNVLMNYADNGHSLAKQFVMAKAFRPLLSELKGTKTQVSTWLH